MSVAALNYVKPLSEGINHTEKLLMFVIADYHNDEEHAAWPSIARLAKETLLSERRVYEVIKELEEKGLIRVERGGGRTSNRYSFPAIDTPAGMSPPANRRRGALRTPVHRTLSEPPIDDEQRLRRDYEDLCSSVGATNPIVFPDHYWKMSQNLTWDADKIQEIVAVAEQCRHKGVWKDEDRGPLTMPMPGYLPRLQILAELVASDKVDFYELTHELAAIHSDQQFIVGPRMEGILTFWATYALELRQLARAEAA